MAIQLLFDPKRELALLERLARAHDDHDGAETITAEDIARGREILDELKADDRLVEKLPALRTVLSGLRSGFAGGEPIGLKLDLKRGGLAGMTLYRSGQDVARDLGEALQSRGIRLVDLLPYVDDMLGADILPEAWDGSRISPSPAKLRPERVAVSVLQFNAAGHFFEVLSFFRMLKGLKSGGAPESKRSFVESFLVDVMKYLWRGEVHGGQQKVLLELVELALHDLYGIDAVGCRAAQEGISAVELNRLVGMGDVGQEAVRAVPPEHRRFLVRLLRGNFSPLVAYALRRLFTGRQKDEAGEIISSIHRMAMKKLAPEVERRLHGSYLADDLSELLASHLLLIAAQPLVVHQGDNPFAGAYVMAIAYVSGEDPLRLLSDVEAMLEDGHLERTIDGETCSSAGEEKPEIAPSQQPMDAVSVLLVPELDGIVRAARRSDRRRLNSPGSLLHALYGGAFPHQGASVSSVAEGSVHWPPTVDAEALRRMAEARARRRDHIGRFYGAFHPEYGGDAVAFPVPVTLSLVDEVGFVKEYRSALIRRVSRDDVGEYRVYYSLPSISLPARTRALPSSWGHGEKPGEYSLPFAVFAGSLRAFPIDGKLTPADPSEEDRRRLKKFLIIDFWDSPHE